MLLALDTYHAFTMRPSYLALADLSLAERATRMADPAAKAAILGEVDDDPGTDDPFKHLHTTFQRNTASISSLAGMDYEPDPASSMAGLGRAQGRGPVRRML